jgi:hypothetical protein
MPPAVQEYANIIYSNIHGSGKRKFRAAEKGNKGISTSAEQRESPATLVMV